MTDLDRTANCLEALGNPTRLAIYRLLVRAGVEGKPVGQIQRALEIPASTLSHHLKHLEMVGLLRRERAGTTHRCVANYEAMEAALGFLTRECCADAQVCHEDVRATPKAKRTPTPA